MFGIIPEVLLLLGVWALTGALLTSIGSVLFRILDFNLEAMFDWLLCFWVGWSVSIILAQLWHLWFPINGGFIVLLLSISVAGITWNYRGFRNLLVGTRLSVGTVLFAVLAILVAHQALLFTPWSDIGAYHLPLIEWYSKHPIIPGLGNLYDRYGFNSTHFLYAAIFNRGVFAGSTTHVVNGVLLLMAIAFPLNGIQRLRENQNNKIDTYYLVLVSMVWPINIWAYAHETNSDFPGYFLGIVSIWLCLRLLSSDTSYTDSIKALLLIGIFSFIGITIKLSYGVFGIGATILAIVIIARRFQRLPLHGFVVLSILAGLILIPYVIRGYILTGYPLYPSQLGGSLLDLDWRVPQEIVQRQAYQVFAFRDLWTNQLNVAEYRA